MDKINVSKQYLQFRQQVLNDEQVYIAVFDVPVESNIIGADTQTYALIFGLNTHLYFGTGGVLTGLEKERNIMKAMQWEKGRTSILL